VWGDLSIIAKRLASSPKLLEKLKKHKEKEEAEAAKLSAFF